MTDEARKAGEHPLMRICMACWAELRTASDIESHRGHGDSMTTRQLMRLVSAQADAVGVDAYDRIVDAVVSETVT